MFKIRKKIKVVKTIDKIICNVCGRSLEKNKHGYFEDSLHIKKTWGYTSQNDGLSEDINICESCWRKLKENFKIKG